MKAPRDRGYENVRLVIQEIRKHGITDPAEIRGYLELIALDLRARRLGKIPGRAQ